MQHRPEAIPRPPEVLLQNGEFRVIRERESYEDLIRGENLERGTADTIN